MYILFVFSKSHRGDELMYAPIPQMSENPLPPCPSCGKMTLVKCAHEDVYCCLNCPFRKDLNQSYWNGSGLFVAIALISVGVIVFALISVGSSVTQYQDSQNRDNQTLKNIQPEKNLSPPTRNIKPTVKPIF